MKQESADKKKWQDENKLKWSDKKEDAKYRQETAHEARLCRDQFGYTLTVKVTSFGKDCSVQLLPCELQELMGPETAQLPLERNHWRLVDLLIEEERRERYALLRLEESGAKRKALAVLRRRLTLAKKKSAAAARALHMAEGACAKAATLEERRTKFDTFVKRLHKAQKAFDEEYRAQMAVEWKSGKITKARVVGEATDDLAKTRAIQIDTLPYVQDDLRFLAEQFLERKPAIQEMLLSGSSAERDWDRTHSLTRFLTPGAGGAAATGIPFFCFGLKKCGDSRRTARKGSYKLRDTPERILRRIARFNLRDTPARKARRTKKGPGGASAPPHTTHQSVGIVARSRQLDHDALHSTSL